jgi:hypothetical protein
MHQASRWASQPAAGVYATTALIAANATPRRGRDFVLLRDLCGKFALFGQVVNLEASMLGVWLQSGTRAMIQSESHSQLL